MKISTIHGGLNFKESENVWGNVQFSCEAEWKILILMAVKTGEATILVEYLFELLELGELPWKG